MFFGTRFKIAASGEESGEVVVSCIGIGYSNVNKSVA
jgi:RNA 3'-terminal phosphate cyclase-like protein